MGAAAALGQPSLSPTAVTAVPLPSHSSSLPSHCHPAAFPSPSGAPSPQHCPELLQGVVVLSLAERSLVWKQSSRPLFALGGLWEQRPFVQRWAGIRAAQRRTELRSGSVHRGRLLGRGCEAAECPRGENVLGAPGVLPVRENTGLGPPTSEQPQRQVGTAGQTHAASAVLVQGGLGCSGAQCRGTERQKEGTGLMFLSWCWPSLDVNSESLRVRGALTAGFCAVRSV